MKRLMAPIFLFIFVVMSILIGTGILSSDINSIVVTGITGCFGLLGVGGLSKHG